MRALPSPGRLDSGEGHFLGIDAESAAGGKRPDLWEGFQDGFVRNSATAASIDLETRATQCCSGERNRRTGHFADFNETDRRSFGPHVTAR